MVNKVFPLSEKQTNYLISYVDHSNVQTVADLFNIIYKLFPGRPTSEYTEIATYIVVEFGIAI